MRQRISHFLVVLLLMFSGKIFGQNMVASGLSLNYMSYQKRVETFKPKFSPRLVLGYSDCTPRHEQFLRVNPVASSYYTNSLGLICLTELKLDKITPLPIRLRLGSLEYVNWMEQKPNSKQGFVK